MREREKFTAINIIFFVNSFRIEAHKITHGNGSTMRCLSGDSASLSFTNYFDRS